MHRCFMQACLLCACNRFTILYSLDMYFVDITSKFQSKKNLKVQQMKTYLTTYVILNEFEIDHLKEKEKGFLLFILSFSFLSFTLTANTFFLQRSIFLPEQLYIRDFSKLREVNDELNLSMSRPILRF